MSKLQMSESMEHALHIKNFKIWKHSCVNEGKRICKILVQDVKTRRIICLHDGVVRSLTLTKSGFEFTIHDNRTIIWEIDSIGELFDEMI